MRVLITGGAGFIGSHLAEACLNRSDEVWVLDDLSTGSILNLDGVRDHPDFHYDIERVQNAAMTEELVDRADMVFHLAASVGVRRVIDSPVGTIENNLQGCETVFAAASKKGKRVLYTSTSEVYGLSTELPFREDGHLLLARRRRGAGATPAPRRWTNSWLLRTAASEAFPSPSSGCSTRWGRGRRGTTAW